MADILQIANDLINFVTNPFFLIAVIFWASIAALIIILGRFKKSKALSVFFPFLAMLKTTRLNRFLSRVARKSPRTWKLIFTFGIFVSFAFTVYGFWYFISNLVTLLTNIENPEPSSQITPLVPGLTIDFSMFIYLIIPILFVLTIHEFSHAISANADGIPVKSTGVLGMGLFFIIGFGAFVEIDEKAYKRGKYSGWQKTRLAAAGSFSNAALAGVALLLLVNFTSVVSLSWGSPGLTIHSVIPAAEGGYNEGILFPGDVLLEINGTRMIDIGMNLSFYLVNHVTQNDTVDLLIYRGGSYIHVIAQTGVPPPEYRQTIAYMGIRSGEQWWPPKDWFGTWLGPKAPNTLYAEIFWLFQIAISVTIFNMMPLPIFDGDKCVYEVINHLIKPRKEKKSIKERFVLGSNEKTYEFGQVNVESVQSVLVLPDKKNPDNAIEELAEHRDFQVTDSDGDGKIDHVTFELSEKDLTGRTVEVEYTAEVDGTEAKKRRIMNVIRVIALVIILGNFIVSGITMGFTMPFSG